MADITKDSSIKAYFKEMTDQRISVEAVDATMAGFNVLALKMTRQAEALSKAENRTTILGRDIEIAFQGLGGVQNTPEGLFEAIEQLEPEVIGQLALKIAAWVKEHRQALGMG